MLKTKTIYKLIFSFIIFCSVLLLMWYVREQITYKIKVIQAYYSKEIETQKLESNNSLKDSLEILTQQELVIKRVFLESDEVVNFITRLELDAQSYGLKISIENIEYGAPEILEQKYTVKTISFKIDLEGEFTQIESFIASLSGLDQKIIVKELKLYKLNGKDSPIYNARIIIGGTILSYE